MASEIRVTNIKANDGTASLTVANSTGNVSVGGTLATTGNTTVGGTLTSTGAITASGGIANAGTISAGTFNGTVGSSATITAGIAIPDFTYNLSVGSNRTITIGPNQIIVYGAVNANGTGTGSGNSAGTGVYGPSSSSGSPKAQAIAGDISKTGARADTGRFLTVENSLYTKDRLQGYFGDGGNNVGAGTLSPGVNRWSAQFDSSDDYELKIASGDSGVFYFWFNIVLD